VDVFLHRLPRIAFDRGWVGVFGDTPYHSLAAEFPVYFDATGALPEAQRVAAFKAHFNSFFPGFYEPAHDETQARFDDSVATPGNLNEAPSRRTWPCSPS
jgi:hypothetical protein